MDATWGTHAPLSDPMAQSSLCTTFTTSHSEIDILRQRCGDPVETAKPPLSLVLVLIPTLLVKQKKAREPPSDARAVWLSYNSVVCRLRFRSVAKQSGRLTQKVTCLALEFRTLHVALRSLLGDPFENAGVLFIAVG